MRAYQEFSSLNHTDFWCGADEFYLEIQDAGKLADLEFFLEEFFPDGASLTEINDLLRFQEMDVRNWLGMKGEEE